MSSSNEQTWKHPERRRAHWRLSGRKKRSAEAGVFQDLGLTLPLTTAGLKPLDKVGVLRVAVSYVKTRRVIERLGLTSGKDGSSDERSWLQFLGMDPVNLLDGGFLILLASNGDIIYLSEGGANCFQCEENALLGTNLYDHVLKSDYSILDQLLSVSITNPEPYRTNNCIGVGATDLKTRRKSATVHIRDSNANPQLLRITGKTFLGADSVFVGIAGPLPTHPHLHPLSNAFPYPQTSIVASFTGICTLDLKGVWGDPRWEHYVGFNPLELVGLSAFQFVLPEDTPILEQSIKELHTRGQIQTPCYRALVKNGGWAWFLTRSSLIRVEEEYVEEDGRVGRRIATYCVGRGYMLSEVMERDKVVAAVQMGIGIGRSTFETAVEAPSPAPQTPPSEEDSWIDDEYLDDLLNLLGDSEDDSRTSQSISSKYSPLDADGGSPEDLDGLKTSFSEEDFKEFPNFDHNLFQL